MTKLRVMRVLVYEGDEEFIKNCLGEQRFVKGKVDLGRGNTITEGCLSGDVGELSFVKEEDLKEKVPTVVGKASYHDPGLPKMLSKEPVGGFCVVCGCDIPLNQARKHTHSDKEWAEYFRRPARP